VFSYDRMCSLLIECVLSQGGEVYPDFGGGEGTIWMDEVNCAGEEKALSKCEFRGWGKHDCSHQHDVGVCCNDNCVAILKAKNGD